MKVLILSDITGTAPDKNKNKINYAKKGEQFLAIERNDESLLVHCPKGNFILFKSDENKTYKII